MRVRFRLTEAAVCVLELDNQDLRKERGIELIATGTGRRPWVEFECSPEAAEELAKEFDARTHDGWDHPPSWKTCSRKAAETIRKAIR